MADTINEVLPIPNPENFTSSPPLQTRIGLALSGETHFLNPKNTYSPNTDDHIKEVIEKTVKSCAQIEVGMVDKLDTAHRNERKENWETISVDTEKTRLFGADGKSEEWRKNAAGEKLGRGKTELTEPEKTFVAQFEIWSQNFQAHFDLNNNKQQVFLNNFLHGSGGATSLVVDKNADFQKVALETYEQFIRKLDTKQAQQSTVFIDRVKNIYGNTAIPEKDMSMIATLAEQLFGGETMGKVISEIVDLQAKLRSGDPAAVQTQLSREIGKTPTPEVAAKITRFRDLAEIAEEKYDSASPPKPASAPSPILTLRTGPGIAPAIPAEALQNAAPKENEQLMKKADEVVKLAQPIKTNVFVIGNADYFGTDVDNLNVESNGYAYSENVNLSNVMGNGSCHIHQNNEKATLAGDSRVYCQTSSKQSPIEMWGNKNLLFTPKDFDGQFKQENGADAKTQHFIVPDDITKATNKTERSVDGHKYVVVECENLAKDQKAHAVFEEKQIAEPGKQPQSKWIFIDGDLTDNYMALEKRLLQKTSLLIDIVDPAIKDEKTKRGLTDLQDHLYDIIANDRTGNLSKREPIAKILGCKLDELKDKANKEPSLVKSAILEFYINEQVHEEIADLAVQKTYTQFGKTGFSLQYVPPDLIQKLELDDVETYSTNGQVDPDKLTPLYDASPSTPKPPAQMIKSIAGFCNAYKQTSDQVKQQRIEHYYSLLKITRPTSFKPTLPGAPEQTLPQFEAPKTLAEMESYHHYVTYKRDPRRPLINIRATGRIDRGLVGPNKYLIDVSYLTDAPVSLLCVADKGEDRCGIRRNPDDTITMVWAGGIGSGIFPALVAYEGVEYALGHLDASSAPTTILQSVSDHVQTLKLDELADRHFKYEWGLRRKGITFAPGTEEHNDQESITGDDGNTDQLQRQLGQINRYRLIQKSFGGMSMTAAKYSPKENKISFAIAGNTGVIVYHRNRTYDIYDNDDRIPGTQIQFETEKNPKHDPSKEIIKDITLENNDVVIGYSDGFYKAFLPNDVQPWIDEYFAQTNPTTPLEQFLTTRLKSEIAKRTPDDPGDDVTIIVLHHKQTVPEAPKPEPIPEGKVVELSKALATTTGWKNNAQVEIQFNAQIKQLNSEGKLALSTTLLVLDNKPAFFRTSAPDKTNDAADYLEIEEFMKKQFTLQMDRVKKFAPEVVWRRIYKILQIKNPDYFKTPIANRPKPSQDIITLARELFELCILVDEKSK